MKISHPKEFQRRYLECKPLFRTEKKVTLERWALKLLMRDQFTLSTKLIKANYLVVFLTTVVQDSRHYVKFKLYMWIGDNHC